MIDYNVIFSFALAYLVTFAAVPIVRVLAFKMNAVDVPKDERRMHKKPIPRWGGTAIYLGFVVSVACFTPVIDERLIGILLGSLVMVATGILDDKYALKASVKLLGQCAAAIVVIAFGVRINVFNEILAFAGSPALTLWVSIIVTFVWIIIVTNAVNLIDGLDGLAASLSGISALALVFICIISGKYDTAVILVAVAGSCMGFLQFNSYPAKIFMGDSGALFLGYILSTMSVMAFLQGYSAMSFIVPVVVLAIPIFDTSFAIIRRIYHHKGIMSADRGHLHHRLIDSGFSQKETVTIMSTFSALLSIAAIVFTSKGINRVMVLIIAMVLLVVCIKMYKTNKSIEKIYLKELEEHRSEENEQN